MATIDPKEVFTNDPSNPRGLPTANFIVRAPSCSSSHNYSLAILQTHALWMLFPSVARSHHNLCSPILYLLLSFPKLYTTQLYSQEDVEAFIEKLWAGQAPDVQYAPDGSKNLVEVTNALFKVLQELYGKYKFMEKQLVQQKRSLVHKVGEIESALAVLGHVTRTCDAGQAVNAQFELSDAVYVKATIEATDKVMLWLGANVMVEYEHAEAEALLSTNLKNAQETLTQLAGHLEVLKDQITVSEVNFARVHNYRVALVQAAKKAQAENIKTKGK